MLRDFRKSIASWKVSRRFVPLSGERNTQIKTSVERWWNGTDGGKPKYLEKNLSQHHFVRHKSHMDWSGIEPAPPQS